MCQPSRLGLRFLSRETALRQGGALQMGLLPSKSNNEASEWSRASEASLDYIVQAKYIIAGILTGGNKMEKKSQEFSLKEAKRLAGTPAGKELAQLLQQTDQQALNDVVAKAKQGNYQDAAQQLQQLLSSPQAQALLKELGK